MAQTSNQLIKEIANDLTSNDLSNNAEREALLLKTKQLTRSLERGRDSLYRLFTAAAEVGAISVAIEMGLMSSIANTDHALAAEDLAKALNSGGVDVDFIRRIMRTIAAYGAVDETEAGYMANNVTKALAEPVAHYGIRHMLEVTAPAWLKLPDHLKRLKYEEPSDPKYTALSMAMGQDGTGPFELVAQTPNLDMTNKWFQAFHADHRPYYSFYPLVERWPASSEPSVFVDVGGGLGHQAVATKEAFPQLKCRYIVQDTEMMVAGNTHLAEKGVEFWPHDFFTQQPVKGAAVYYLRHIIHDWPDAECVKILSHLRNAMTPDYSKLLLHEWVLPETQINPFLAAADLTMMAALSAKERTFKQYTKLLNDAGLEVTGLYRDERDAKNQDIIESVVRTS